MSVSKNVVVKASLVFDVVLKYIDQLALKVLKEDDSQLSMDYPEMQIQTGYFFEMIFIEKSRMCEGSYG